MILSSSTERRAERRAALGLQGRSAYAPLGGLQ